MPEHPTPDTRPVVEDRRTTTAASPVGRAPRIRVQVRPSVILFVLLVVGQGCAVAMINVFAADRGFIDSVITPVPLLVLIGSALALATLALHEAGHVLGFMIAKLHWHTITLAARPTVAASGPRTHHQDLLITILGPLMQLAVGVVLLLLGPPWSVFGLIGAIAVVDAMLILLIPFTPASDAARMHQTLRHVQNGEGSQLVGTVGAVPTKGWGLTASPTTADRDSG